MGSRWSTTARCPECCYELDWDEEACPNCGTVLGEYEREAPKAAPL